MGRVWLLHSKVSGWRSASAVSPSPVLPPRPSGTTTASTLFLAPSLQAVGLSPWFWPSPHLKGRSLTTILTEPDGPRCLTERGFAEGRHSWPRGLYPGGGAIPPSVRGDPACLVGTELSNWAARMAKSGPAVVPGGLGCTGVSLGSWATWSEAAVHTGTWPFCGLHFVKVLWSRTVERFYCKSDC